MPILGKFLFNKTCTYLSFSLKTFCINKGIAKFHLIAIFLKRAYIISFSFRYDCESENEKNEGLVQLQQRTFKECKSKNLFLTEFYANYFLITTPPHLIIYSQLVCPLLLWFHFELVNNLFVLKFNYTAMNVSGTRIHEII